MARKHGTNLVRVNYFADFSTFTDDVSLTLARLTADYTELVTFRVVHQVAGVGAQNIVYTIRGGSGGTNDVSGATGNCPNATKDTSGTADGLGPTLFLAEGHFLTINANFAAAVTNGPKIAVEVLFRR